MSELSVSSPTQWIQFFRNAGLPSNVAASYAIVFSENRIQLNMLMDLSKEYLYDMGIKVMGDVIAILKYAKEYHNQLNKEKVLEDMNPRKKISLLPDKRETAVSRIVDHYTRPVNNSSRSVATPESYTMKQVYFEKKVVPQKHTVDLKRRLDGVTNISPVKKIRKVPPEDKGAYQIKMPIGSTARSRKILQQQKQIKTKGSVFNRLGDSVVSSSTDVNKGKVQSASVFSRLGPTGSHSEVSTSTSLESQVLGNSDDEDVGLPLQYQGVLKGAVRNPRNKIIQLNRKNTGNSTIQQYSSSMASMNRTVLKHSGLNTSGVRRINSIISTRSPKSTAVVKQMTQTQGILGRTNTFAARQSVKNRLGRRISSSVTSPTGNTFVQNVNRVNLNESLKNKVNISRTIFQRLGV